MASNLVPPVTSLLKPARPAKDPVDVADELAGRRRRYASLTLGALGVVYGDIGTSPLYAIREVFAGSSHAVPISPENILGVLSLFFWSLTVVVSLKYVLFIMRADNAGEGGIMALIALVQGVISRRPLANRLVVLGLFGAALFFGDSVITPAISVLSALEGLEVGDSALKPYVIPCTLGVLLALFLFQRRGTGGVGAWFGPVVVFWFLALAVLGVNGIATNPRVLAAVNPVHVYRFVAADPVLAFLSLGAVVLAVTGAEALYADMGHFGRGPIRTAWFSLVFPALLLNYFGQGALLLADGGAIRNPFYLMAPGWALAPLVVLATLATVIASQAVISGTYSLAQQASQLGYAPRFDVRHTSTQQIGQIYLPGVNWTLFACVAALVVGFGSSSALASAYGIAVTGTMAITTILAVVVAKRQWRWSLGSTLLTMGAFFIVDVTFFASNMLKFADGGWFPIGFALVLFVLMTTWRHGRLLLSAQLDAEAIPLQPFVESLSAERITTVPGTAVFLTQNAARVPHAMLHSLKHYRARHERMLLVTVSMERRPHVPQEQRLRIETLDKQFFRITVNYGFMDDPDLPRALAGCGALGLDLDMMATSFFLGRETVIPRIGAKMAYWRQRLFLTMFRNAGDAAAYFRLPPNRVVELGAQVLL